MLPLADEGPLPHAPSSAVATRELLNEKALLFASMPQRVSGSQLTSVREISAGFMCEFGRSSFFRAAG
jgi:hypothetical protein